MLGADINIYHFIKVNQMGMYTIGDIEPLREPTESEIDNRHARIIEIYKPELSREFYARDPINRCLTLYLRIGVWNCTINTKGKITKLAEERFQTGPLYKEFEYLKELYEEYMTTYEPIGHIGISLERAEEMLS